MSGLSDLLAAGFVRSPRHALPNLIRSQKYFMFASNGFRANERSYVPGASATFAVYEKWFISDDYWTFDYRALLTTSKLTTAGSGGREAAWGNGCTWEAISIQAGLNGTPVQMPINGSLAPYVMADDQFIWTDAVRPLQLGVPPRTPMCIRVARQVSATDTVVGNAQGYHPAFGDRVEVGTSSLAAKVMMTAGISTAAPAGNNVYAAGPVALAATGWDGRPVGLILGTSIEQGVGTARLYNNFLGAQGPAEVGLVSTASGALRYPLGNWAISGGLMGGITGTGANQGLARAIAWCAALGNPGGVPPFTFIHSGYGTNDQSALSTWIATMQTGLGSIRAAWPSVRLIQSELLSRIATTTDAGTTQANQTLSTNWALYTGSAWGLSSFMKGGMQSTRAIDAFVEIMDYLDAQPSGGSRGKWRTDVIGDPNWNTTLTGNVAIAGGNFPLAARPYEGAVLAIQGAAPEAELCLTISGTSSPFTCVTATSAWRAHTTGEAVKYGVAQMESTGDQLVHPGAELAATIGKAYVNAKLSGVYG